MSTVKVFAISGSLRVASLNSALLRAAQALAPEGMSIEIYDGLRGIPPYDEDHDTDEPPTEVAALRRRIQEADALLIASPKYNYGIPGALKNALDWASRPWGGVLKGKPIAVMGASPTDFGTVRAQLALRQAFLWTGSLLVTQPEVMIPRAQERFNASGRLIDEGTRKQLEELLVALATTSGKAAAGRAA